MDELPNTPVARAGRARDNSGRILTLPPERGCPQPQHERKGADPGAVGQACAVGAAAAEDSRAPAASRRRRGVVVSRCARDNSGRPYCLAARLPGRL
jgi:hypothetical protein